MDLTELHHYSHKAIFIPDYTHCCEHKASGRWLKKHHLHLQPSPICFLIKLIHGLLYNLQYIYYTVLAFEPIFHTVMMTFVQIVQNLLSPR